MKENYGIDLSQKKVIINGRLENYVRSGGWKNYHEYMDAVEHDKTGMQERMLVNFLTTNYTYFMREFEHFDFLKKNSPAVAKRKGKDKKGSADLVRSRLYGGGTVYDCHGAGRFFRLGA